MKVLSQDQQKQQSHIALYPLTVGLKQASQLTSAFNAFFDKRADLTQIKSRLKTLVCSFITVFCRCMIRMKTNM